MAIFSDKNWFRIICCVVLIPTCLAVKILMFNFGVIIMTNTVTADPKSSILITPKSDIGHYINYVNKTSIPRDCSSILTAYAPKYPP